MFKAQTVIRNKSKIKYDKIQISLTLMAIFRKKVIAQI